jgi:hypothetical protein
MPLDHGYGAAVGTFVSFTREDPTRYGSWYHGRLRIAAPAGTYEAALDVDTPSGVGVSYRLIDDVSVADLGPLATLPAGFTPLAPDADSGALDYVRSPLLRDGWIVTWLRRLIARRRSPVQVALEYDLEGFDRPVVEERWGPSPLDQLLRWASLLRRLRLPWRSFPWVRSDGNNALDVLEPLVRSATRIVVLGEPYTTGLGVHNVHQNQGDPPGRHQRENGPWQDGAVVCIDAADRVRLWLVKFNTQSLHTDDQGLPLP